MTNAVGIHSTAPIAAPAKVAFAPTSSSPTVLPTSAAPTKLGNSTQNFSISPRITDDPAAGLIVQYLDSTGAVQSQIPSTRVVAYLRAGLTAEGLSKQATEQTGTTV